MKGRRYFQYRVTEVEGSMVGKVKIGDLTIDYWQGKSHWYTLMDFRKNEVTGGYGVKSEGECTSKQYDQLEESGTVVDRSRAAA